jgi:hypothetical protein
MGTLSGQTISNTYDGLLKLEDSTAGITSSLQYVQDGLGNNSGIRIAENQLFHRQLTYTDNFKPDYGGTGFGTGTGPTTPAGIQNKLGHTIMYDKGLYTYSSVTYHLSTATSTGDVVNVAFYDAQFINGYGLAPKDLIMSGITLTSTGSTGIIETALPSNLTFTAGSQYYFICYIISNSGVTPTVQYRIGLDFPNNQTTIDPLFGDVGMLGMALFEHTTAGQYICRPGGRATSAANTGGNPPYSLGFQTSYTENDILTSFTGNTSVAMVNFAGLSLKTI